MSDADGSDALDPMDAAWDALEAGEPAQALALVDRVLADDENDPHAHLLAGLALLDLGSPVVAADHLRRATLLDPGAADARAHLADALFRSCKFEAAEAEAQRAMSVDPEMPLAHHVLGLAFERRGQLVDADRAFDRAVALDPDSFVPPTRMTDAEFEQHVIETIDSLPDQFRAALDAVAVTVEAVPLDAILFDEDPPLDPGLLGLFVGVPLTEQSSFSPAESTPRIFLFQRNLEKFAASRARLVEEIAVTLQHELGHYLGMSEDEIEDAGHG